jgi:5-methylcytosine-specific restriction endonuclease McrA
LVVLVGKFSSDPVTRELWNSFSLTTDFITLVCISFNFVLWAIGYRELTSEDIAKGVDESEKISKMETDLIIAKATSAETLRTVREIIGKDQVTPSQSITTKAIEEAIQNLPEKDYPRTRKELSKMDKLLAKGFPADAAMRSRRAIDILFSEGILIRLIQPSGRIGRTGRYRSYPRLIEDLHANGLVTQNEKAILGEFFYMVSKIIHAEIEPTSEESLELVYTVVEIISILTSLKCYLCGATEDLEIDHIIPLSRDGESIPLNRRVMCRKCNVMKDNR